MVQAREGFGFAGESFGEGGIVADARRQYLERNETIQLFLARLINSSAHAAFADERQEFELRKQWREFGDGGRDERRLLAVRDRVRRRARREQAGGAKPIQRLRREVRAALRTGSGHAGFCFRHVHTPSSEAKPAECYRKR